MHWVKRSVLSILRRKGESVILLLLTIALGIIVSGSFLIHQGTSSVRKQFIEKTSPKLYVTYALEDNIFDLNLWTQQRRSHSDTFTFYYNTLAKYAGDSRVKDIQYSLYKRGYARSFRPGHYPDVAEADPLYSFILFGVNKPLFADIQNLGISIVSGRSFTENELLRATPVCIANADTMVNITGQRRKVRVGDQLTIDIIQFQSDKDGNYIDTKDAVLAQREMKLTVIGTYQVNDISSDYTGGLEPSDKLFVPDPVVLSLSLIHI